MAVGEWQRMQDPECYSDGIFRLVLNWGKLSIWWGIMLKN